MSDVKQKRGKRVGRKRKQICQMSKQGQKYMTVVKLPENLQEWLYGIIQDSAVIWLVTFSYWPSELTNVYQSHQ